MEHTVHIIGYSKLYFYVNQCPNNIFQPSKVKWFDCFTTNRLFEVDLFWRFWQKSPFLVIDSSRTKHSLNIIECVLEGPMLYLQNELLTLDIAPFYELQAHSELREKHWNFVHQEPLLKNAIKWSFFIQNK